MKLFLITLLIPLLGYAEGNDAGGGGNAVVCRNSQGIITSAETLDLFEARALHQWQVVIDPRPALDQAISAVATLQNLNWRFEMQADLQNILQKVRILSTEYKLEPVGDAFPPLGLKGCAIEQLARYLPNGELIIDGEIWATLNETSKAALYLHELLYKRFRYENGATNSLRARRAVGYLMALDTDKTPIYPSAKEKIEYTCDSVLDDVGKIRFVIAYSFQNGTEVVSLYFSVFDSHSIIGQMKTSFSDSENFFKKPSAASIMEIQISSIFERNTFLRLQYNDEIKPNGKTLYWKAWYGNHISSEHSPPTPFNAIDVHCDRKYNPKYF